MNRIDRAREQAKKNKEMGVYIRQRQRWLEHNPMYDEKLKKKATINRRKVGTYEKVSRINRENGVYEKFRQDTIKRNLTNNPMSNPETVKKVFKTRLENGDIYTFPNKIEIKLWEFLEEKFPGEWDYVGNWSFWIDRRNPDFVHSTKNKVIELFGDYWHKNDDPEKLIQHYRKNGFDCLVIWERELKDMKKVFERVRDFNELK